MDIVVGILDDLVFDSVYKLDFMPHWDRDYWARQSVAIFLIFWLGGYTLYFIGSSLSWQFLFDKKLRNHPRFLPNQEWLEIKLSLISIPIMAVPTTAIFLAEVRGYSKLYTEVEGVVSIAPFNFISPLCTNSSYH
jgi:lathosterol oxidase